MNEEAIETKEEAAAAATEATEKPKKKSGRHLKPEEQLARIAEKQKQLAAQARAIRAREEAKERKARAHRLIKVGAVAEAVFGAPIAGADMLARLESFLRKQDERGHYFTDALKGENV